MRTEYNEAAWPVRGMKRRRIDPSPFEARVSVCYSHLRDEYVKALAQCERFLLPDFSKSFTALQSQLLYLLDAPRSC